MKYVARYIPRNLILFTISSVFSTAMMQNAIINEDSCAVISRS